MSVINAFPLYIAVIFLSVFLMFFSQKWLYGKLLKFRKFFFFLSFVPLWYISAFTSSGADYEQYAFICYDAAFRIQESYTEFGWNSLSLVLTFIFKDPYKSLFVIQTITLSLFIYAFYLIRKEVSLWLSLLAFEVFLFFNFGLMSIYLSVAIIFLSIIKFTHEEKKKSLLLLVLASTIHSSALFWLPAYLLAYFINKYNMPMKRIIITLSVATIIFIGMVGTLVPMLVNLPIFQQYSSYDFEGEASIGLGNIILYFMYSYLLVDFLRNKESLNEKRFLLVLVIVSFAYMLLGYMIPTVTRMKFYTVFITAFLIPKALYAIPNKSKLLIWFLFIIMFGGLGLYKIIMTEEYLMSSWIYFNPW